MDSERLLAKAERYMHSATILADNFDYDSASSRLYYAMFYVVEVLLDRLNLSYSSHHASLAAYGKHFAKTKQLDPYFHRALLSAFEMRDRGDYAVNSGLTREDVDHLYTDAQAFLAAARQWLADHPQTPQA